MKLNVCRYRNFKYGFDSVVCSGDFKDNAEEARISEYVVVDFPDRDQGEVIAAQVSAMDAAIDALQSQILVINQQKQELLALGIDNG